MLPAAALTALGPQISQLPFMIRAPPKPMASAVLSMVPMLPGSWIRSRTSMSEPSSEKKEPSVHVLFSATAMIPWLVSVALSFSNAAPDRVMTAGPPSSARAAISSASLERVPAFIKMNRSLPPKVRASLMKFGPSIRYMPRASLYFFSLRDAACLTIRLSVDRICRIGYLVKEAGVSHRLQACLSKDPCACP